jgi:hypothetical protein
VSKEARCPSCLVGKLSWHDTTHNNETDQGDGKPYVMCGDQHRCGFIMRAMNADRLREIYRRVKVN